MATKSAPVRRSELIEPEIVAEIGLTLGIAFRESITAMLSRIAATIPDTEKTPPAATSPMTNSFKVESDCRVMCPVAASANTTESKIVGAS